MRKGKYIRSYTEAELKEIRGNSGTDLKRVDAMTGAELERAISEDEGESDLHPDWTRAELVMPEPKQSVHLRLEQDVVEYFKMSGKGHISRMQAVLKAYVNAHRPHAK